jgi:cysteine-rich repeat protein
MTATARRFAALFASSVLAMAAGCSNESPAVSGDTGVTLDGGGGDLEGLDVSSDAAAGDAQGDGGDAALVDTGGDGSAEEVGDAADAVAEDGVAEDAGQDGAGVDLPAEDTSGDAAQDASGDGNADAVEDPVADADATGDPPTDLPVADLPAPVCADGAITGTEQCDDENTTHLDGCDNLCRYEQVQLITDITFRSSSTTLCGGRRSLNNALSVFAQAFLQIPIADAISAGTLNILFDLLDLDDPAGVTDSSLSVGVVAGSVYLTHPPGPGSIATLDAWYLAGSDQLDGDVPAIQVDATLSGRHLNAGPFDVDIPLGTASVPVTGAQLSTTLSTTRSMPSAPPDALREGFTTFEGSTGILCGDVPQEALDAIPAPSDLLSYCHDQSYVLCETNDTNGCASVLDVLVGGCTESDAFPPTLVTATNPDDEGNYGVVFNIATTRVHLVDNYPPAE